MAASKDRASSDPTTKVALRVAITSSEAPRQVGVLAVDPQLAATIYAGGDAIFRSDDAGTHWTSFAGPDFGRLNALGTDPQRLGRLWAATNVGLSRSEDGGQTWLNSEGLTKEVYQFLVDGRRLGTLYASSYDREYLVDSPYYPEPYTARAGGPIFVTTDGGKKWAQTADSSIPVRSFALDPFEYGAVYAATLGAVYRSKDFGASWENLVSMDPDDWYWFFSIVPDPVRRNYLYASTSYGVVRSTDGGRTWLPFSRGLPSGEARALVISPDGRRLHVGTNDGVFELDLEAKPSTFPCVPGGTRLCLVGNRYAVDLVAARKGQTTFEPGAAQASG